MQAVLGNPLQHNPQLSSSATNSPAVLMSSLSISRIPTSGTTAAPAVSPSTTVALLGLAPLPTGGGDLLFVDFQNDNLLVAFPDDEGDTEAEMAAIGLEDAGRLLMGGLDVGLGRAEHHSPSTSCLSLHPNVQQRHQRLTTNSCVSDPQLAFDFSLRFDDTEGVFADDWCGVNVSLSSCISPGLAPPLWQP